MLKKRDGYLALSLSGLSGPAFREALAEVKTISGRRWNPDTKDNDFPDDVGTALEIIEKVQPELDAGVREMVKDAQAAIADDLVTKMPEDAELSVPWAHELYPFQRSGVEFMVKHPHTILADEMGLGKTLECISAVEETGKDGPVLVICPNMVRGVWDTTLRLGPVDEEGVPLWDDWPGFAATVIHGDRGKRGRVVAEALHYDVGRSYIIINWEKLRLMPELAQTPWAAVIADEAHRAKNRNAKQAQALHGISAPLEIAATGTPIMNSPDELWSILRWLRPEQYTSYWAFDAQYVEGYRGYKGHKVVTGVRNPDALRFELADKLIRRTKLQVKDEIGYVGKLPPIIQEVDLHPKQRRAYEAAEDAVWLDVKAAMDDPEVSVDTKRDIVEALKAGNDRSLGVLIPNTAARIVRQRQIATSPALVPDSDAEDISATLDAVQERINDNPGKPFVVFCWYRPATELLAARLRRQKPAVECETLHGEVPQASRQQVVDDFQNGEYQVLICTIATGGTGLTLTRADTCIFFEEDWTPAMNNQAIDRLDRIGQKSLVTIVKVRAKDTVHTKRIVPTNRLKELMAGSILGQEASQ